MTNQSRSQRHTDAVACLPPPQVALPSGMTRMLCLRFSLRRSSLDSTIVLAVLLTCAARFCTERLAILFGDLATNPGEAGPEETADIAVAVVGEVTVRGSEAGREPGKSMGEAPSETTRLCSPLHLKTREMASEYFTRSRSSSNEWA